MQHAERGEDLAQLRLLPTQRGDGGAIHAGFFEAFVDRAHQRGMRGQLQEMTMPRRDERLDRFREAHRLAHIFPPIRRAKLAPVARLAAHGRIQRQRGARGLHRAETLRQFTPHRVHVMAVEGIFHLQEAVEDAARLQRRRQLLQRVRITGQTDGGRPVHRAEHRPALIRCQQRLRIARAESSREHAAVIARVAHAITAVKDDARRLAQREHAGDVRRSHFADAVTHHRDRAHAQRFPNRRQRDLNRKDGRLCDGRVVHARTFFIPRKFTQQRPRAELAEQTVTLLDLRAENGVRGDQLASHAPPLRSLAGTDENRPVHRAALDLAADKLRGTAAFRECGELTQQIALLLAVNEQPMRMRGAPQRRCTRDVHDVVLRFRQIRAKLLRGLFQRIRAAGGKGQNERQIAFRGCFGLRGLFRVNRLRRGFEHGMRIRTAKAEGIDSGIDRAASRQFGAFRNHTQMQLREVDVLVRLAEVQVRRDFAMFQHQRQFDESRDACGGLEMAEIRLHRADEQRILLRASTAERCAERVGLQRIAHGRSSAVRLDVMNLRGLQAGGLAGFPHQRLLRLRTRHRDAIRAAILVRTGGADDGIDFIPVRQRGGERFQQHRARAFATHEAVRTRIKGLAAARGRKHAHLAEGNKRTGAEQQIYASAEGHAAIATPQAAARKVQPGERG